jgi:hypothetical protein
MTSEGSGAGQLRDHRGHVVDRRVEDHYVGDAQLLAGCCKLVDDLRHRSDQGQRGATYQVGLCPERGRQLHDGGLGIAADRGDLREDVQFEVVEAVPGTITNESDALGQGVDTAPGRSERGARPGKPGEADDVRLSGGKGQDLVAVPADEERDVWALRRFEHRPGTLRSFCAREAGLAGPGGLHSCYRLAEAGGSLRRPVVVEFEELVLGLVSAGAEAELEAPVGEQVDGSRFLGEAQRVEQVVVDHQAAHP